MVAEAAKPLESIGLARSIPSPAQRLQEKTWIWNASGPRAPSLTWIRKRRKLSASGDLEVTREASRRGKVKQSVVSGAAAGFEFTVTRGKIRWDGPDSWSSR